MGVRFPVNENLLKRLQFLMEDQHPIYRPVRYNQRWDEILGMNLIRSLQSLNEIHITCAYSRDSNSVSRFLADEMNTYNITVLNFRVLPITKAMFILNHPFT